MVNIVFHSHPQLPRWFSCDCAPQAQSQKLSVSDEWRRAAGQDRSGSSVLGEDCKDLRAADMGKPLCKHTRTHTHTSNPISYTFKSVWMPPVLLRASFWLDVGVQRQTLIITLAQSHICRVAFNIPPRWIRPSDPEQIHYCASTLSQSRHYKRFEMLPEAQKCRRNVWQMCFFCPE